MARSNSDYLMQLNVPLNRVILDIGFLRSVLRTSRASPGAGPQVLDLDLDLVLDLVLRSQYTQILD